MKNMSEKRNDRIVLKKRDKISQTHTLNQINRCFQISKGKTPKIKEKHISLFIIYY